MESRIKPPDYIWTFKCGEKDWLSGKLMLCNECKWKEPHERPEKCPNTVKVDMGPKY